MKLLIVIVNYRTPDLTIDCLRSLEFELPKVKDGVRVIVVDGGSGDDSVKRIDEAVQHGGWGDWVTVLPLKENGGFAYGNNAGIRAGLAMDPPPDYVHLLNPDTIVRPGGVTALLDFMDRNPGIGIAGSRLEDPDGTPQRSAFRFHSAWSELENGLRLGVVSRLLARWVVAPPVSDTAGPADWVSGASMMIRREVLEAVDLLDDGYFMYYEEVDFCLRAKRAGWACAYVPQSRVVHLIGQASGIGDRKQAAKRRPAYWFASRRRYFVKNHGRLYAMLADGAWLVGFSLWRLRRIVQGKPDCDPPRFLSDSLRESVFLRGFAT